MKHRPNRVKAFRWSVGVFVGIASAAGIAIRAAGYPAAVPQVVSRALMIFIEPGLAIWWFTVGGVFQGFPSDAAGYLVAVVGNIGFWLLVVMGAAGLVRWLGRRVLHSP